jgi:hypothetical protein
MDWYEPPWSFAHAFSSKQGHATFFDKTDLQAAGSLGELFVQGRKSSTITLTH